MSQITILSALLHGDENIKQTAASILPQLDAETVWMIKYSKDAVPEDLEAFVRHPRVKVIAESDSCIYEGLNQGLQRIATEYFMVVGAGDTLEQNALSLIQSSLKQNSKVDSLFFAVVNASTGTLLLPRPQEMNARMACPHPGALLRTANARSLGGFDLAYEIASDYDLLSRYLLKFTACGWSDQPVVRYMGGGLSDRRSLEGFLEEELVRIRSWRSPISDVCARGERFFVWANSKLRELHGH
jgi:hypothetical protein